MIHPSCVFCKFVKYCFYLLTLVIKILNSMGPRNEFNVLTFYTLLQLGKEPLIRNLSTNSSLVWGKLLCFTALVNQCDMGWFVKCFAKISMYYIYSIPAIYHQSPSTKKYSNKTVKLTKLILTWPLHYF